MLTNPPVGLLRRKPGLRRRVPCRPGETQTRRRITPNDLVNFIKCPEILLFLERVMAEITVHDLFFCEHAIHALMNILQNGNFGNFLDMSAIGGAIQRGDPEPFSSEPFRQLCATSPGEPSVVTLKPAICGQFKTGHRDWPKT
jgi:hypothetical protein